MHVHPPKPPHSWREFAGEIGIIVIGILIALGLEQAIEAIHWHHKVEQATGILRDSMATVASQAVEQQVTAPCVDRQIADLRARLTAPGPFQPAPDYRERERPSFTIRRPSRDWSDDVWHVIGTEGVSTHLPTDLRRDMDEIYAGVSNMQQNALQAEPVKWRLSVLALPLAGDPSSRIRLAEELADLEGRSALMTLLAGQLLDHIRRAGLMPPAAVLRAFLAGSGSVAFCRGHHLPLATLSVSSS